MADYHILQTDSDTKTVNVVFHISIPSFNNVVGVSYRTALVNYLGGAANINSVVPDITTTELDNMKIGAIYEKPYIVRFSSLFLTDAQRLEQVEMAFTQQKSIELNEKQMLLRYYGKSGNVT